MAYQQQKTVRVELTDQRQRQVQDATGKEAVAIELSVQELVDTSACDPSSTFQPVTLRHQLPKRL